MFVCLFVCLCIFWAYAGSDAVSKSRYIPVHPSKYHNLLQDERLFGVCCSIKNTNQAANASFEGDTADDGRNGVRERLGDLLWGVTILDCHEGEIDWGADGFEIE